MSLIFSLLKRKWDGTVTSDLPEQLPKLNKCTKLMSYSLPGGKEPEIENGISSKSNLTEINIFTQNEMFGINSQKKYYLQNIHYFIPGLYYFYKPDVCLDLAVKFTIRHLSGLIEVEDIQHLQNCNPGIYNHFVNVYKISQKVYQYSLGKDSGIPLDLSKMIFSSLIEFIILQREEDFSIPVITYDMMKDLNMYTRLYDSNFQTKCDKVKRGTMKEFTIHSMHYMCFSCLTIFDQTSVLREHIKEMHSSKKEQYVCITCEIQFDKYQDFCAHCLTFCRKVINDICNYCCFNKEKCKCRENFSHLYTIAFSQVYNSKIDTMYNCGNFSMFLQNFQKIMNKEERLSIGSGDETQKMEIKQELIPTFEFNSIENKIQVENYNILYETREGKQILSQYKNSYHEFLDTIYNFMASIVRKCGVYGCTENLNGIHYAKQHLTCPVAILSDTQENIVSFTNMEIINHCIQDHCKIRSFYGYGCSSCMKQYSIEDNIDTILDHLLQDHNEMLQLKCEGNTAACSMDSYDNIKEVVGHMLAYHTPPGVTIQDQIMYWLKLKENSDLISFNTSDVGKPPTNKINTLLKKYREKKILTPKNNTETGEVKNSQFKTIHSSVNKKIITQSNDYQSINNRRAKNYGSDLDNSEKESSSEDENHFENVRGKLTFKDDDKHLCKNETHEKPLEFKTKEAKTMHIIRNHHCNIPKCNYYNEYEFLLLRHFNLKHKSNKITCTICGVESKNLKEHMEIHPSCMSCEEKFLDQTALVKHMKMCTKYTKQTGYVPENMQMVSKQQLGLELDCSNTEHSFTKVLERMMEATNLSPDEIQEGKKIFSKFASESLITKKKLRSDLGIKNWTESHLLFEIPDFTMQETTKDNLTRASQLIGPISKDMMFSANVKKASQMAVQNFEILENITQRLYEIFSLCNIREQQAKIFLQQFLAENVLEELCGFTMSKYLDLSYYDILKTLQTLFCPLRLDLLESKILSYQMLEGDSLNSFTNRAFRHISLVAKKLPKEERPAYIETHICRLIRNNLPSDMLKLIMSKEEMYTPFTSSELLNFYNNNQQKLNQNQHSQYNVFNTMKSENKFQNKYQNKSKKTYYSQNSNYNNYQQQGYNFQNKDNEYKYPGGQNKNFQPNQYPPRQNKNFQPNQNRYPQDQQRFQNRPMTLADRFKLVGPKYKNACLLCLEEFHRPCPHYQTPLTKELCVRFNEMGRKILCGFHPKSICVHRQKKLKPGAPAIWGAKRN